jgi:putative GTP pyrophosphokinase
MIKGIPSREQLEPLYESRVSEWQSRLDKAKDALLFMFKYDNCPVKYLYVSGRVKSFGSLYSKAVIMKMAEPFNDIDDLLGLRIVCLYRNDISEIAKFIQNTHSEIEISERPRRGSPNNTFGYDAQHYILTHHDWLGGKRIQTKIELQIRSILMDAWASISHDLDYKMEIDIPIERKRDFYALSAALYSIDSQFELLRAERQRYAKQVLHDLIENKLSKNLELNRENLALYFEVKFPEVESQDYVVEILENSLRNHGVLTIKMLDDILNRTATALLDPELKDHIQQYVELYVISIVTTALSLYCTTFIIAKGVSLETMKKRTISISRSLKELEKNMAFQITRPSDFPFRSSSC